jgi:hypothetical protein
MSQNDMSIANASGSTVRADINSAIQALASNSSYTSAPGTTYDTMYWFDQTNNILKIRDEANANWVNIASLVSTTWVPYSNGAVLGTLANQNASAIGADLVMSAKAFKGALATVASASNVNLDTAAGNSIDLTGTTTITAFTIAAGALYFLRYTGAGLTLTHNASTLVLPTGASITVATGDTFLVYGKATNEAVILAYQRASGAALVGATAAAAQSDQETATSITAFVTPGRQQFHPSAAKCWGNTEMTGTHSIRGSFNLSSVTDEGVGLQRFNFTIAFSSSNYAATSFGRSTVSTACLVDADVGSTKSASQFSLRSLSPGTSNIDSDEIGMAFFGDQ